MAERCVYRGGNWNNGTNAGLFNLNANNGRTNANNNIGFRAALRQDGVSFMLFYGIVYGSWLKGLASVLVGEMLREED